MRFCSPDFLLVPDLEDLEPGWSMIGMRPPYVETASRVTPAPADSSEDSTVSTDLSTETSLSSGMQLYLPFFFMRALPKGLTFGLC